MVQAGKCYRALSVIQIVERVYPGVDSSLVEFDDVGVAELSGSTESTRLE